MALPVACCITNVLKNFGMAPVIDNPKLSEAKPRFACVHIHCHSNRFIVDFWYTLLTFVATYLLQKLIDGWSQESKKNSHSTVTIT